MVKPQYPINLNVEGRPCLVVGGGEVATRKVEELCRCGAVVTVVSPTFTDKLEGLGAEGTIDLRRRPVEEDDVDAAFIVIAATDDLEVNRWVSERATRSRALVNVVDQPSLCVFTAPAVVRRGLLTVTVSTNGASPALSKRLRRQLEQTFGEEWADVVEALGAFRERLFDHCPNDFAFRKEIMDQACELDAITIIREEGRAGLEARLERLLNHESPR